MNIRKAPSMLIVGAAERGLGKTEFVCRLIKTVSLRHPLYAIKTSIIRDDKLNCPNYRTSCGLCANITDFLISEELNPPPGKDTAKMLKAGAARVFLIRAFRDHLKNAVESLFEIIPEESVIVCESNSMRKFVQPGLFLVIKRKNSTGMKASCRKAAKFADAIIEFDGGDWSVGPERIAFTDDGWRVETPDQALGET
ncbi:MAG: hypothetical protein KAG97_03885 [Victivallales bacterium]|nr:hypothetical protein [Victivallales bacterium]